MSDVPLLKKLWVSEFLGGLERLFTLFGGFSMSKKVAKRAKIDDFGGFLG